MTPSLKANAWRVAPMDRSAALPLAKALGISPLVAHLMMQRGVTSLDTGQRYMKSSLENLSPPSSLRGMTETIARLTQAKDNNEHVLVFGDYDVDGISGTAVMLEALRRFGLEHVSWDLPDRDTGYGLDASRVSRAKEDGVDLIVTVDNGITAFAAAEQAKALSIDLIITDHHSPAESLPPAVAIVNPRLEAPDHPSAHLSGAALAWKVGLALTESWDGLDLACLGLVADLMPLQGEVRDLVVSGLFEIRNRPRLGLQELARVSRVNLERMTAETIAFQLGPRINAAGRLGDPRVALDLLLTEDPIVATENARALNTANEERRLIEQSIYDDALAKLEDLGTALPHSIVLASDTWHHGVIGIVAAKIQRRTHKPVLLIAFDEDGVGRGSGRGMKECNLVEALAVCEKHLVKFGGHSAAAGLTIHRSALDAFRCDFDRAIGEQLAGAAPTPSLRIDAQVALSQIDMQMLATLDQLQPFGQGNPSPVFCTFGAELLTNSVRELKGGHLRFSVKEGPHVFTAMGFSMGEWRDALEKARKVDIAFVPALNEWNGTTTIQLLLQDVRILN